MDSFKIKVIAIVSMLLDHVGLVFFPDVLDFRFYGRLEFPLFAFLIAEGFVKTSNPTRYLWRLMTLAVISQVPFVLMLRASGVCEIHPNIFFTLSAGLFCLILIKKYKHSVITVLSILSVGLFVTLFRFDYGIYGFLLILSSYLFIKSKTLGTSVILLLTVLSVYLVDYTDMSILQIFALLALPLMCFYNGEQGHNKYKNIFYYIYPVSMFITVLVKYGIEYYPLF